MDKKRQDHAEIATAAAGRAHHTAVAIQGGEHPVPAERAPKLGEILVAQGKITQEQLAIALELQKTSGRRLGEELVKAGFVKRAVISRALRIQRRIVFSAITTLAASSIIPSVDAATVRSQIAVTAYVPAQAVAKLVVQPSEITITEADVARGYVDIPAASQLQVTSNNPAGYVIDFFSRLPIFTSVRVSSAGGGADLGPDGGAIIERGRQGRDIPLNLSYRFNLAAQVRAGTYAWPLALNIRPL
jgi:DNA-binding Lrp family transcriptional regulator